MANELIEHYEREFEYSKALGATQENINKATIFLQFLHFATNMYPEASTQNLSYLCECFQRFLSSRVLFPLTLAEGEFIFQEPGISVNRRNPFIKWTVEGIYYEKAYKGNVIFAYDSFTGNRTIISDTMNFYGNPNRIYIKTGKYLTNIYFDLCYIYQTTIDSHKFTPANPVMLPLYAMVYKDNYILFVNNNEKKLASLKSLYDVRFKQDSDEYLKNFGITNKISIDAILKKERFAL